MNWIGEVSWPLCAVGCAFLVYTLLIEACAINSNCTQKIIEGSVIWDCPSPDTKWKEHTHELEAK